MKFLKISLSIFIILSFSRFIPHPPNFTSLIALSFYVPAIFGIKYLSIVVISFALTDLFFGFHPTILFTWGSVIAIGLLSKYLSKTILNRIFGALFGAFTFSFNTISWKCLERFFWYIERKCIYGSSTGN